MGKIIFILVSTIIVGMALPSSAQMYTPPMAPADPGRQYNGSGSDWRSSNNNGNDWRSRSDNWREDRTQGNWRNNTWRDRAEKDDWRENNWRKDFKKDNAKNEKKDSAPERDDGCDVIIGAKKPPGCP